MTKLARDGFGSKRPITYAFLDLFQKKISLNLQHRQRINFDFLWSANM